MKWLYAFLVGLAAFLLGGLAIAPTLVEWNAYRPDVEARFDSATGLSVTLEGNISVDLLPRPRLTAAAIRIADPSGEEDLGRIRWLRAHFSVPDLLQGRIAVRDVTLVEPDLVASPSWLEARPFAPDDRAQSGGEARQFRPGPDIEFVTITNGSLTPTPKRTGAASGPAILTGLDGTLRSVGRTGRFVLALAGRHQTGAVEIDARLSPIRAEGAAGRLSLEIVSPDLDATARAAGTVAVRDARLHFVGTAAIDGRDAGPTAALFWPPLEPLLSNAGELHVEAEVEAGPDGVSLRDIGLDMTALTGRGEATVAPGPRLDLDFRFSRMNLDMLLADAAEGAEPDPADPPPVPSPDAIERPQERFGVRESDWFAGAIGSDLTARIAISAGAVQFRDGLVRNLTFRAAAEQDTVTVEELTIQLPGGTDASIAGFGMLGADPSFEGNATLRTDDLHRLLLWLGLEPPNVPQDRLRAVSMVSGLRLVPGRLDVIDATLSIDGTEIEAAAAVALRARPGIGLRVAIDQINLDAYRMRDAAPVEEWLPARPAPPSATERPPPDADPSTDRNARSGWNRVDARIAANVGLLIAGGIPVRDIDAELSLGRGYLAIDRAAFADAAGVSGVVRGGAPLARGAGPLALSVEGESGDLGRFMAVATESDILARTARELGPVTLAASLGDAGDALAAAVDVRGPNGGFAASARVAAEPDGLGVSVSEGRIDLPALSVTDLAGRALWRGPRGVAVERMGGLVNGGRLTLSADLGPQEGVWELAGALSIEAMDVKRTVGEFGGLIGAVGTASLTGEFAAFSHDNLASFASSQGLFEIAGAIHLDLAPLEGGLSRVRQVRELRNRLAALFGPPARRLWGRLQLTDGRVTTDTLTLDGDGGARLGFRGSIDLLSGAIDGRVAVREAPGADPFAELAATGRASGPDLRLTGSLIEGSPR